MKRRLLNILVVVLYLGVWSLDVNAQEHTGKVSHFIRDILGGDSFEQELLDDHPGGQLIWKEQVVEDAEGHFTCLVYSEFIHPGEEPRYYFYEVKVRFIPPAEMFQDIPNN